MKPLLIGVVAFISVGVIFTVALALQGGLDRATGIYLTLTLLIGALGFAAVRRAAKGMVAPGTCPACGGTISPHAPYCKHCGNRLDAE